MKKLLLIILCVPLLFSCNGEKDNYDKLIGYTYSGWELDEKLKEWESNGGRLLTTENHSLAISFYAKDNQRLVISQKTIGRKGQKAIFEIIGYHIVNLEENQTLFSNITLDGEPDDGIIAIVIYEDWECTEILKAWKLNIYSGEFEYIDVMFLSCYTLM